MSDRLIKRNRTLAVLAVLFLIVALVVTDEYYPLVGLLSPGPKETPETRIEKLSPHTDLIYFKHEPPGTLKSNFAGNTPLVGVGIHWYPPTRDECWSKYHVVLTNVGYNRVPKPFEWETPAKPIIKRAMEVIVGTFGEAGIEKDNLTLETKISDVVEAFSDTGITVEVLAKALSEEFGKEIVPDEIADKTIYQIVGSFALKFTDFRADMRDPRWNFAKFKHYRDLGGMFAPGEYREVSDAIDGTETWYSRKAMAQMIGSIIKEAVAVEEEWRLIEIDVVALGSLEAGVGMSTDGKATPIQEQAHFPDRLSATLVIFRARKEKAFVEGRWIDVKVRLDDIVADGLTWEEVEQMQEAGQLQILPGRGFFGQRPYRRGRNYTWQAREIDILKERLDQ